jgi:hypothetical protein
MKGKGANARKITSNKKSLGLPQGFFKLNNYLLLITQAFN